MNKFKRLLASRVYIRKIGVPVWVTVLALVVIGATAAQAVGPVLSGNIVGNVGTSVGGGGGVTVSQSIVLATGATAKHIITGADDFTLALDTDGTAFTAAIETTENKPVKLLLDIDNKSKALTNAFIFITSPDGFTVDADNLTFDAADPATADFDTHGVSIAQFNATTWLMTIPGTEVAGDQDIQVTIRATTGFHTVRVVIKQMTPPG